MNSGNSVQDADPRVASAVPGQDADLPAAEDQAPQPRPPFRHVQDIQELIDKLAAVNMRLRYPGSHS